MVKKKYPNNQHIFAIRQTIKLIDELSIDLDISNPTDIFNKVLRARFVGNDNMYELYFYRYINMTLLLIGEYSSNLEYYCKHSKNKDIYKYTEIFNEAKVYRNKIVHEYESNSVADIYLFIRTVLLKVNNAVRELAIIENIELINYKR